MDGSDVDEALEEALLAFEGRPTDREPGIDSDDDAVVQLRKACRLLDAGRQLRATDGFTVVIESSFVSIERTIHFYLLEATGTEPNEFLTHENVYNRGAEANLYSESIRDRFLELWRENRSRTYYRQAVGDERQADAMLALAETVHQYVLDLTSTAHECICGG